MPASLHSHHPIGFRPTRTNQLPWTHTRSAPRTSVLAPPSRNPVGPLVGQSPILGSWKAGRKPSDPAFDTQDWRGHNPPATPPADAGSLKLHSSLLSQQVKLLSPPAVERRLPGINCNGLWPERPNLPNSYSLFCLQFLPASLWNLLKFAPILYC